MNRRSVLLAPFTGLAAWLMGRQEKPEAVAEISEFKPAPAVDIVVYLDRDGTVRVTRRDDGDMAAQVTIQAELCNIVTMHPGELLDLGCVGRVTGSPGIPNVVIDQILGVKR